MMDKYFEYRKHKTDFKTEVTAGVTTFLTMAYIMFLNPFILSGEFAGTDKGFFDFGGKSQKIFFQNTFSPRFFLIRFLNHQYWSAAFQRT